MVTMASEYFNVKNLTVINLGDCASDVTTGLNNILSNYQVHTVK